MLALDWPGHGESPLPATPLRAVEFGDLLIEFADRLDLANAVIVGNSVGGYAALKNYTSLGGQLTVFALP